MSHFLNQLKVSVLWLSGVTAYRERCRLREKEQRLAMEIQLLHFGYWMERGAELREQRRRHS